MNSSSNVSEGEWVECYSKTHQQKYWFNTATNKSVWVDPTIEIKSGVVTAGTTIYEDSPIVAAERDRCAERCLNILVTENTKYGAMQGNTKTSRSCNKDGMRIGMLGIYARVIWSQLLNEVMTIGDVGSSSRDAIFPSALIRDEAVIKEFIDGGRTPQQAEDILSKLGQALLESSRRLIELQTSSRSSLDNIQIKLTSSAKTSVGNKRKIDAVDPTEVDILLNYQLSFEDNTKSISGSHFKKLLRLYRLHTNKAATINDPIFLRRAYCVISRYETLSGNTDGYQMAFPDPGFQWLRNKLGVKIECFASPLNCWNQRICSVARDTDQFFGSLGNFFLFEGFTGGVVTEDDAGEPIKGGSFEANPPFVESVMNDMAKRIEYLLTKYKDYPFSVTVVVPAWTDCEGIDIMCNSVHSRPYRGYKLTLEKKQHDYRPGMQHRTSHEAQPSNVDTFVFFLQNDKGADKWPVTVEDGEELKRLLRDTMTQ